MNDATMIDGTSVLMKFNDLFEIEKWILVAYLEYRDKQQVYFQIQFIELTVGSIEKTKIYLQFVKNARREHDRERFDSISKKQRVYYSNLKGSPQRRRINEKKRQYSTLSYAQIKGSLKFGSMMYKRKEVTSFDKSVTKFKTLINSRLVFVCVLCNRCLYQKSVIFLKST